MKSSIYLYSFFFIENKIIGLHMMILWTWWFVWIWRWHKNVGIRGWDLDEEHVCTSKTVLGLVVHQAINTVAKSSWPP